LIPAIFNSAYDSGADTDHVKVVISQGPLCTTVEKLAVNLTLWDHTFSVEKLENPNKKSERNLLEVIFNWFNI